MILVIFWRTRRTCPLLKSRESKTPLFSLLKSLTLSMVSLSRSLRNRIRRLGKKARVRPRLRVEAMTTTLKTKNLLNKNMRSLSHFTTMQMRQNKPNSLKWKPLPPVNHPLSTSKRTRPSTLFSSKRIAARLTTYSDTILTS